VSGDNIVHGVDFSGLERAIAHSNALIDQLREDKRILLAALQTLISTIDEDACTCASRSWYGTTHDSACPLTYYNEALAVIDKVKGGRQ